VASLAWFGVVMSAQWRLSDSAYEDARLRALVGQARGLADGPGANTAVALLRVAVRLDPAQADMTDTLSELTRLAWRGAPHRELPFTGPIRALSFAVDDRLVVDQGAVVVVDLATGALAEGGAAAPPAGWRAPPAPLGCSDATGYLADDARLLVRCGRQAIELWDRGSGTRMLVQAISGGEVTAGALDPRRVAVGTRGGRVHVWTVDALPVASAAPAELAPARSRITADGVTFEARADGPAVSVWAGGAPVDVLGDVRAWGLSPLPLRVLVANDGGRIAARTLGVAPSPSWARELSAEVRAIVVHPDGEIALVRTDRDAVWHVRTGLVLAELPTTDGPLGFSADGARIVADRWSWTWSRPRRATLLPATGAWTNLRTCPDSLRAVAVVPWPDPESVDAPESACRGPG
jgi:hypothetical protein